MPHLMTEDPPCGCGLEECIAARRYLSPLTVKTRVNRASSKLRGRDRAQIVVVAYRPGLVRAGEPDPR